MKTTKLMVWIDQDLCTGDGICEEIAPDVFEERDDGLWVVKETVDHFGAALVFDAEDEPGHGPEGSRGVARVPDSQIEDVIEAAEECPGECIMIEPYNDQIMADRGV
jgi:ferredoxin